MYYWWRSWLDIVGDFIHSKNIECVNKTITIPKNVQFTAWLESAARGLWWLGKSWLECAQQAPGARFWRTKRAKNVRRMNGAASWGPDLHRPRRNGTRPPLGWYSAVSICYRDHLSTEIPRLWSLNVNLKTTITQIGSSLTRTVEEWVLEDPIDYYTFLKGDLAALFIIFVTTFSDVKSITS